MLRILTGLTAVVVAAAAGLLAFDLYVQHRVAGEIEATFEQIRAGGGKASHGKVSFDLLTRTVTVLDIAAESTAPAPVRLKIASLTASGVHQSSPTRFSADSIEVSDIEGTTEATEQVRTKVTYKVPRFTVKDFSGPASLPRLPASSSVIDIYRIALEQFSGVTASSVTAPTAAGTVNGGSATPDGGDFTYSGLAIAGIENGKIASAKLNGLSFAINAPQAGKAQRLTANISNVIAYDFDANAAATVLAPQNANDDRYYRVYRQIAAGPYVVASEQGLRMKIDKITFDDLGVRPSKMQLPAILAIIPQSGARNPTPAQVHDLLEKTAEIYEGIRVGKAEVRDISVETPKGSFQMSALRYNLENGQGELAFDGLDSRSPEGPFKLERFALKSLNVAQLLRWSTQFSNPAQRPSPEQTLGLFRVLEGVEIKGVSAPYKNTNKLVNIDTLSLDWGQLVGPIPSKAHLVAKMVIPVDATKPELRTLFASGIDKAAIDIDLGVAWSEESGTLVLAPASLEIGNMLKASARVALGNVPRGLFSVDPVQAANLATQIEAGTIELTLRDTGSLDLAVAQFARNQNVSRESARRAVIDNIKASAKTVASANPDVAAAVEAVSHFVETPGQTLVIKLTPRGKVPALQLVQILTSAPLAALSQFRLEVSTGL